MAGYSSTPLLKKLGFDKTASIYVGAPPDDYESWLGPLPEGTRLLHRLPARPAVAHVFVTKRTDLEKRLKTLRARLDPTGFVWISWPKKSSGVPSEVTEDVIRELALPMGWVDIKVCAVSEVWSGLKLVIRKELR